MVLTVDLGTRSYPVYIDEPTALADLLDSQFPGRSVALVTNETIRQLYGERIDAWEKRLRIVECVIPDGEEHKTLQTWSGILDRLLEARLDRGTVLVAFGGGIVGDVGGFAASAFLRGITYVQVPTTLLAMVDSSVGGKTGVNHGMGKNLIGAFHQPELVYIDTAYLDTLPERELVSGYAEVFKYGFIGGREMFDFIADNHEPILARDREKLLEAIRRSVSIKAEVVSADERESGNRALLNFGHTFCHALEKYFNYQGILHGEAVHWGMALAVDLGIRVGTIPKRYIKEYERLMVHSIKPTLPSIPSAEELYDMMFSDKKVKKGKIRFVLPEKPGTSGIYDTVERAPVIETLELLKQQGSK